jgi:hypothetical protein
MNSIWLSLESPSSAVQGELETDRHWQLQLNRQQGGKCAPGPRRDPRSHGPCVPMILRCLGDQARSTGAAFTNLDGLSPYRTSTGSRRRGRLVLLSRQHVNWIVSARGFASSWRNPTRCLTCLKAPRKSSGFFVPLLLHTAIADTLQATGAEDKPLRGRKLSADSGAKTRLGFGEPLSPSGGIESLGLASTRKIPGG